MKTSDVLLRSGYLAFKEEQVVPFQEPAAAGISREKLLLNDRMTQKSAPKGRQFLYFQRGELSERSRRNSTQV